MAKRFPLAISALVISIQVFAQGNTFITKDDKLIDAEGKAFIIKGMNNPHAWFGEKAYHALDFIHEVGCNTVRIVWQTSGKDADLEKIINRVIELEMIPMVELHDVTGSDSKEKLLDMARWYCERERVTMLKKYERYLLLNIANEWGGHVITNSKWLDSYTDAVKLMRESGYLTTIVVDGSGWGQNINPLIKCGQDLIAADPLHNILLSVHMYGSWNNPEKIRNDLKTCHDLKLPVIVGEFGYNYSDGKNNLGCKADHTVIISTCNELGYGFMPWSWTGNNKQNQWLDLVDPSDWKTLTWWGKQVISAPGGITQTAKKSAVFDGVKSNLNK